MRFRVQAAKPLPPVSQKNRSKPPSITSIIENVLEETKRPGKGYFRPSMFYGCRRKNVYHYRGTPREKPKQTTLMLRILDSGNIYHELIQRKYVAENYDILFAPEVPVRAEVGPLNARLQGHADGVLTRRSDGYSWLLEIKTVSSSVFRELEQPKADHVAQASIYARLLGLRWISFLYYSRDIGAMKEYIVEVEDEAWEETVKRATSLKKYVDAKKLPLFDAKTCDPDWCDYSDRCKTEEGGCPSTFKPKKWGK